MRVRLFVLVSLAFLMAGGGKSLAQTVDLSKEYTADKNTILLLNFNKGTGAPEDSSSFHHAVRNNANWTSIGKFGSAMKFGGNKNWLSVSDTSSLSAPDEMTVELWIKPSVEALSGTYSLMTKGGKEGRNRLNFSLKNGKVQNYPSITGNKILKANTWYHIAYVITGTSATAGKEYLFINGVLDKEQPSKWQGLTQKGALMIGAYNSKCQFFAGIMDEIRISNIARPYPGVKEEKEFCANFSLIKDLTYTYSIEPNHGKDRDTEHAKLIDGKGGNIHWTRSSPEIEFDLKTTYLINRIEIKWYRNRQNWAIKDVSLFMDKGTGYELVNKVETNLDKLPYPAHHTLIFENIDKEAHRLKLRVFSGNRYFGISEIKIYGKLMKKVINKSNKSTNSSYTNFPQSAGELIFKKGSFDSDPDEELFLCNRFFSMIIEPQLGGVITYLAFKGSEIKAHPDYGILGDHVTTQSAQGDWYNATYEYKLLEERPDRIRLQLSCSGKSGVLSYLTFNKILTVWRDRSYIQVDYDIALSEEAQSTLPFGFWFHQMAGPEGAWDENKNVTYFFPVEEGIKTLSWHEGANGDHWYYKPVRGWTGFVDQRTKSGLVYGMDYKYVNSFYVWASTGFRGKPTHEWRFYRVPIEHGDSFKTTVYITPFHELEKLSGANKYLTGSLDYQDNKIITKIISGKEEKVNLKLRYKILPNEKWINISEKKISLSPNKTISLDSRFHPVEKGSYVFSVILEKDGKELLNLEEPKVIGKPTGSYALLPKEKQYTSKTEKINLTYTSMDMETPHIKWARPYYQGKTKAIVLMNGYYQREIVELAQRIDLDFDTTYLYPEGLRYFGDYLGILTQANLKKGLERLLKDNPDWEVFITPGYLFKYFSAEQQKSILNKVKEGCGLVIIEPDKFPPLSTSSPLQNKSGMLQAKWKKEKEHFITTGIPFEALPATGLFNYQLKKGEALVSAKENPLLAIDDYGKGRVVSFAYCASSSHGNGSRVGLLPRMHWRARDLVKKQPIFNYFEYHFSLLSKAILWAAKKEPSILIEKIEATPTDLNLSINNKGKERNVILTLFIKDKYGKILDKTKKTVEVPTEKGDINIPYSLALPDGVNLFDIFIKDNKGKVINWASTSLKISQPVTIAKVETDRKFYQPEETINLKVYLKGKTFSKLSLKIKLIDGFERLIAEKKKIVDTDTISFNFRLKQPLNYLLNIQVDLMNNNKKIDSCCLYKAIKFPLKKSAHQGDPYFLGWTSLVYHGTNNYLLDYYRKRLFDVGVNAAMHRYFEVLSSHVLSCLKYNNSFFQTGWGIGGHPQTTGDPEHPQRKQCLNDPAFMPEKRKSASLRAQNSNNGKLRILGFLSGDENRYSEHQDICFSPYCLKKFCIWLQKQYLSLEQLNKEWDTKFKTWDEVKPLTLKESKEKGNNNFASWCDHRTFGEVTYTEYFGMLTNAIAEVNPELAHCISGTPHPSAHAGYDYWLLSKALSSVFVYYGYEEFSSWNDRQFNLFRWLGYTGDVNWAKYNICSRFFEGCTGVAFCSTKLWFNPDMTYSKVGLAYKKAYKLVKDGVGRLLIESNLTKQPIGMHYSQNSLHVAHALGKNSLWKDSREGFQKLCESSGFDISPISYQQVEEGKLKDFKVLCLPFSYSLSKKEVTQIENFVQDGGILIAQLGVGLADKHGKFLAKGSLDHVFGIKRTDSKLTKDPEILTQKDSSMGPDIGETSISFYETGLSPASAEVLGELREKKHPVAFINKYGKGLAVYLGCDLFPSWKAINGARTIGKNSKYAISIEDFLTQVLNKSGIKPQLVLTTMEGEKVPFTKTVLFKQGDVKYFGLLRDYLLAKDLAKEPIKGKIKFPSAGYIYEIFMGRDYGFTDEIETVFTSSTVQIYSVLPYKVTGISLSLSKNYFVPGDMLPYEIRIKGDGEVSTHTLRMDVFNPEGKLSVYSKNITAGSGKAKGVIPLALNDKKGKWTIKVKDLTSGKKTEADFYVK